LVVVGQGFGLLAVLDLVHTLRSKGVPIMDPFWLDFVLTNSEGYPQ
jgi:hypothetical protein